jgi:hypothetical protein
VSELDQDRRNPYLILGLDYGASKDEARRAAARVLRKLKSASNSPYTTEDVTWALHEVEHVNDDPEAGVTIFRVPASEGLLAMKAPEGIFAPPSRPEPRSSPPSTEEDLWRIAGAALVELASGLLSEFASVIDTHPTYTVREES